MSMPMYVILSNHLSGTTSFALSSQTRGRTCRPNELSSLQMWKHGGLSYFTGLAYMTSALFHACDTWYLKIKLFKFLSSCKCTTWQKFKDVDFWGIVRPDQDVCNFLQPILDNRLGSVPILQYFYWFYIYILAREWYTQVIGDMPWSNATNWRSPEGADSC